FLSKYAEKSLLSKEIVSAVLMTEREGKQVPIYFVSRTYSGRNHRPANKAAVVKSGSNRKIAQMEI
ncbi:hypothetical protein Tco_0353733, partial [Tanacetum coccineum]